MKRIPRIILLIPTRRSYERGILRGIVRYAILKGPWAIYHPLPIKQIARDLGYSSPKHIARAFRNEKGMTLVDFRKKFGQGPQTDASEWQIDRASTASD